MAMETIFADKTVSISSFKAKPAKCVADAANKPLAVLSHNRPAFYALSPELFSQIADLLDDVELADVVRARLADLKPVEVSIDDL